MTLPTHSVTFHFGSGGSNNTIECTWVLGQCISPRPRLQHPQASPARTEKPITPVSIPVEKHMGRKNGKNARCLIHAFL